MIAPLVACGSENQAEGPENQTEGPTSIVVALPSPAIAAFAQPYIAEELGYFDDEDLVVEIVPQLPGGTVGTALLTDQVQIGGLTADWFVPWHGSDEGADQPVELFFVDGMWVDQIMAPADSAIESAQDLIGKTIGVPEAKDEGTVEIFMSSAGVRNPNDYETLVVGGRVPAAVAMDDGRIDAFAGTFVDEFAMQEAGYDVRVLKVAGTESFYNSGYAATPEFLAENEEVAVGFGRAYAKAAIWMHENPEAALEILSRQAPEATEDPESALLLMQAATAHDQEQFEARYETNPAKWEEMIGYFVDQGVVESPYDASVFYTNDLLDDIWDFDVNGVRSKAQAGL